MQDRRDVGDEPIPATNAELIELRPLVERIGGGDQRLGWHAADAGAGRAVWAAVDEDEAVGAIAHFSQGGKAGRARTHDGHIYTVARVKVGNAFSCANRRHSPPRLTEVSSSSGPTYTIYRGSDRG